METEWIYGTLINPRLIVFEGRDLVNGLNRVDFSLWSVSPTNVKTNMVTFGESIDTFVLRYEIDDFGNSPYSLSSLPDGKYELRVTIRNKLNVSLNGTNFTFRRGTGSATTITVKKETPLTIDSDKTGVYQKISFKLNDLKLIKSYSINEGTSVPLSAAVWGDVNNISLSTAGAMVGLNTLSVTNQEDEVTRAEFLLGDRRGLLFTKPLVSGNAGIEEVLDVETIDSVTSEGASETLTVTMPENIKDDLLLVTYGCGNANDTIDPPTGWTELFKAAGGPVYYGDIRIYYKFSTGEEAASYDFVQNGVAQNGQAAIATSFRNVDLVSPFLGYDFNTNSDAATTTITSPKINLYEIVGNMAGFQLFGFSLRNSNISWSLNPSTLPVIGEYTGSQRPQLLLAGEKREFSRAAIATSSKAYRTASFVLALNGKRNLKKVLGVEDGTPTSYTLGYDGLLFMGNSFRGNDSFLSYARFRIGGLNSYPPVEEDCLLFAVLFNKTSGTLGSNAVPDEEGELTFSRPITIPYSTLGNLQDVNFYFEETLYLEPEKDYAIGLIYDKSENGPNLSVEVRSGSTFLGNYSALRENESDFSFLPTIDLFFEIFGTKSSNGGIGRLLLNSTEGNRILFNEEEYKRILLNNVVIWEKGAGPTVWKRRIMVGDDIAGKTVSITFPLGVNYWQNITGYGPIIAAGLVPYAQTLHVMDEGDGTKQYVITMQKTTVTGNNIYTAVVTNGVVTQENTSSTHTNIMTSPQIVTSVVDNVSQVNSKHYRQIFIEDPNIRPIEVGDNLSGATLYLTFPDDFHTQINDYEGSFIWTNNSSIVMYDDKGGQVKEIFCNALNNPQIYNYSTSSNSLLHNVSKVVMPTSDFGVVGYAEKTNPAYNHILVDTTTLGTPEY